MITNGVIIDQTKKWITDVVVGCNFCPFAARVMQQKSVFYKVELTSDAAICLETLLQETTRLDEDETIETIFLILPASFENFDDFVELTGTAEDLLIENGYEGIYQLASFHPDYLFAASPADDAANYTNRSPYPMLHLLRESSIDKALEHYKHPENIPDRNIEFARNKGIVYMKLLRDACL